MLIIEKVARALAYCAGATMAGPGQSVATREFGWKMDGEHNRSYAERHWRSHVPAAMFAVGAMKEPTPEMMQQWRKTFDGDEEHTGFQASCPTCGGHVEGYRTMIQMALEAAATDETLRG